LNGFFSASGCLAKRREEKRREEKRREEKREGNEDAFVLVEEKS
jgi:hypothetical protein